MHCFFTLAVMALCTAFRLWKAQGAPESRVEGKGRSKAENEAESVRRTPDSFGEPAGIDVLGGEGTERWRRRLKKENRDKVIVFVGETYGIFHVAEFSILGGLRVKDIPQQLGSRQAILARYGLSP